MTDNFTVWDVKFTQFNSLKSREEKLKFFVNFAVLSPSSHNSQPWKFTVRDNSIEVSFDKSRSLPVGDPENRLAYVSIGCCIQNLICVAEYYGYKTQLVITNNRLSSRDPVAVVKITPGTNKVSRKKDRTHLATFISKRATNRGKYRAGALPKAIGSMLKKAVGVGLGIYFISDKDKKAKVVDLAISAGIDAMENKAFREELARHVKPNITSSKTGMPAYGMGIPTPISFLAPTMIRLFNMNKAQSEKDSKTIMTTPLFVLITSEKNKTSDWVKVGLAYQEIGLRLTRENFVSHPMAGPIQLSSYRDEIKKIFSAKGYPQFFFRVGRPVNPVKHSPRIPAEEVTVN